MHITGTCHCRAIRYEADVDPTAIRVCHCTDCQQFSGGAFRVSIRAVPGSLRIVAGAPRTYTKVAESGTKLEQAFCEGCGSHLYGTVPGPEPRITSIRVGSIDQRAQLRPVAQIWTQSRLPWVPELATLPAHEKQ